ncbi:MAG: hypothetical protein AAF571_13255 [Verrucomicrobiota bacterium]
MTNPFSALTSLTGGGSLPINSTPIATNRSMLNIADFGAPGLVKNPANPTDNVTFIAVIVVVLVAVTGIAGVAIAINRS